MLIHCDTVCLENNSATRWIRRVKFDNQIWLIESPDYATLERAYVMSFADQASATAWLDCQLAQGWTRSFVSDQDNLNIDQDHMTQLISNLFRQLKN